MPPPPRPRRINQANAANNNRHRPQYRRPAVEPIRYLRPNARNRFPEWIEYVDQIAQRRAREGRPPFPDHDFEAAREVQRLHDGDFEDEDEDPAADVDIIERVPGIFQDLPCQGRGRDRARSPSVNPERNRSPRAVHFEQRRSTLEDYEAQYDRDIPEAIQNSLRDNPDHKWNGAGRVIPQPANRDPNPRAANLHWNHVDDHNANNIRDRQRQQRNNRQIPTHRPENQQDNQDRDHQRPPVPLPRLVERTVFRRTVVEEETVGPVGIGVGVRPRLEGVSARVRGGRGRN